MKGKCATTGKIVGAIRILVGLAMVVFGVMKFGADAATQASIGGAGAALGLTFLSATTRFWVAVIGEIIAGLMLLSGCKKIAKLGAILTLIIMVFAINAMGFDPNAIIVTIGALVVLVMGPGCWGICPGKCCKKGDCCGDTCNDGTCDTKGTCPMCKTSPCSCSMTSKVAGAATGAVEKAGDVMEDITDKAADAMEDVADKVEDVVEDITDTVEDIADKVEDIVDGDDDEE